MTGGSSGGEFGGKRDLDSRGCFHEETIGSGYLGAERSGYWIGTFGAVFGGDEVIGGTRVSNAGDRRG